MIPQIQNKDNLGTELPIWAKLTAYSNPYYAWTEQEITEAGWIDKPGGAFGTVASNPAMDANGVAISVSPDQPIVLLFRGYYDPTVDWVWLVDQLESETSGVTTIDTDPVTGTATGPAFTFEAGTGMTITASGATVVFEASSGGITSINDDTTASQTIGIGRLTGGAGGVNISTSAAAWNSTQNYRPGWIVSSGGSTYRCVTANTNSVPPNANWVACTGDGFVIVNVPWCDYTTGILNTVDNQSILGIKHFYSGVLVGDKGDFQDSLAFLQINDVTNPANWNQNYGVIKFGDPDGDYGASTSGAVMTGGGEFGFDLDIYASAALLGGTQATVTSVEFRPAVYNAAWTTHGKFILSAFYAGPNYDTAVSYCVINGSGTTKVGGWATQGGLEFCGGLYISGSWAVGDILYASTITQLSKLTIGNAEDILTVQGGVPVWNDPGGTWTPTLSTSTNIASTTAYTCQYIRIGSVVTFSGKFDATPTGAGATAFRMSLPVGSNFSAEEQAGGVAAAGQVAGLSARIYANSGTDDMTVEWVAVDTSSRSWSFSGSYLIV